MGDAIKRLILILSGIGISPADYHLANLATFGLPRLEYFRPRITI